MASRFFAPAIPFGQTGGRVANPDPFRLLQRGMDTLLTDLARTAGAVGGGGGDVLPAPQIDVEETDGEIRITAELPGMSEQDLQIIVDDDALVIAGEKREEQERDRSNLRVLERVYGQFRRVLQLPFAPDPDRVEARYRDGILTIAIPKDSEQAGRPRQIRVRRDAGPGKGDGSGREAEMGTRAASAGSSGGTSAASETGADDAADESRTENADATTG